MTKTFATVMFIALCALIHIEERADDDPAFQIYVTNENSGDVSVIDSAIWTVVKTIPVGQCPRGIHFDPRGADKLYVALSGTPKNADGIGVIDIGASHLTTKVNSGEGVTTSPDGRRVFAASEASSEIQVIDTSTDSVIAKIPTSQGPRSIAFLPNGKKAYVTCATAGVVCVIDVGSARVIGTIKPEGDSVRPMGIVISPSGSSAYVTTGCSGSVLEIDTARDEVTRVVENAGQRPWGIAISPNGQTLFTANGPSDDVAVIDIETFSVIKRIPCGSSPWGIAAAR